MTVREGSHGASAHGVTADEVGEHGLGLGGPADFAEPTAITKKRSRVLEGTDPLASVGQRFSKVLVDHFRTGE